MRVVLVAAGALFNGTGAVLLAQRPAGTSLAGLWEFPGGKIEPGESAQAALIRELDEELGIQISAPAPLAEVHHPYPDFHLHMQLFSICQWVGTPIGRQGQALRWGHPDTLAGLAMPPADYPLIPAIQNFAARLISGG